MTGASGEILTRKVEEQRLHRALRLVVAGLLSGCGAVGLTQSPPGPSTSETVPTYPTPTAAPTSSPAADQLAAAGWFRFVTRFPDQDSVSGFDLEVGTLDGRLARTVSTRYGPLAPSGIYRGALPVAAGPFGDVVLYAFWDGTTSQLHSISVTTGEDIVLAERADIIHAAARDIRTGTIFFLTLDPATRRDQGIVRLDRGDSGPGETFIQPDSSNAPDGDEQVWKRLWVTPDGTRLVLVDCPTDCIVSVIDVDGDATIGRVAIPAGEDIVGVTDEALLTVFGCDPPCPATAYDLRTGEARRVGTFCEAGTIVSVDGEASLVSDWPVGGGCRGGPYRIGRTEIRTGADAPIQLLPSRERTLVPLNDLQGAAPPEGWFLLGPGGRLVESGAEQQVSPALVRAADGTVVGLPLLVPSPPPN